MIYYGTVVVAAWFVAHLTGAHAPAFIYQGF
jgi:hypothetical protein